MTKVVFSGFENRGQNFCQMQMACFSEVNEEYKFAEIYQQRGIGQRINSYVVNWQSHSPAGIKQKEFTVREYGTARRALAAAKRYCVELGQRD